MKFRLGLNGMATAPQQHAADGVGHGMQALFMAPLMTAQAAGEAQKEQGELALRQAQQRQADAHAALFGAQADDARAQMARGSLPELLKSAALQHGVPLFQMPQATEYLSTGKVPGTYVNGAEVPGADGMGPVVPRPAYADPDLGRRIFQTLGLTQNALAQGDKSVENVAKATGMYQKQDAVRTLTADPSQAGRFGQAFAAVEGKPLVDNIGNTGRGFNLFTGAGQELHPGMAALFDRGELAQIFQRNSAGTASLASARHSDAGTAKTRAETDQITNGPKGVLVQTDAGPVFADPRSGRSTPVLNADGTPAAPKLKEIPPAQNHAFIENAKNLQNIDAAMDAITKATGITLDAEGNPVRTAGTTPTAPEALGVRNYLGDGVRQRTDPKGVSVRAMVANIGGQRFHDVSGAAVSVGEAKRLQPFIPLATDGPAVALQKLQNMRREYQNVNDMLQQTYSRDQGFRQSAGVRTAPTAAGGATGTWEPAAGGPAAPQRTVQVTY